jgi:two-component system response regulator FixJ
MTAIISIVDDEPTVRDAVAMLLEANGHVPVCYESAKDLLDAPFTAGCIVSDVRMPEMTGLDLLRALQKARDPRPVILLTGHGDIEMAVQAIKIGAFDFIEKPFKNDRLLDSIKSALTVSQSTRVAKAEIEVLKARFESLSERQRDTMRLLVQGLSNKEIAQRLGISPRTVEIHRTWVMTKMSARSIADLVRMGMALGIG